MSFVAERVVKAVRKAHQCDCCGRRLEVGNPAVRWSGMTDGEFASAIFHTDCREAEVALNDLHGTLSDEWMSLRDIEADDLSWLMEAHPIVAARVGAQKKS